MIKRTKDILNYDLSFNKKLVCGCDEAGRGPLAGPVVCAAVIMPLDNPIDKIYDSKKLSEKLREELFEKIIKTAICFNVQIIDNNTIDKVNILNATKLGMKNAILNLEISPEFVIVDAVGGLDIGREYTAITKGDATSYNIAAASILSKVTRDRIMAEYHAKYPEYGFCKNKGYGTAEHIAALKQYGKTEIHRNSFIKNFTEGEK